MKLFLVFSILCVSVSSFAETSQEFCSKLEAHSKISPNTRLKTQCPKQESQCLQAQLNEILDMKQGSPEIAKHFQTGIDQKMSWSDFKKFVKKNNKGMDVPDFHQAAYEIKYYNTYCVPQSSKMESGTSTDASGHVSRVDRFAKTTFEKMKPEDHTSISKELDASGKSGSK